jgi:tetratricopeptide (TPR) repeat protein
MESIIWFDKTIKLDSNNAQPYSEKGCVLKTLERYEDAIELHNKALELDDDYSLAYYYKGDCMKSLNNFTEAIKLFDKAIVLEPKEVLFYVNKGNSLNLIEDGNWGKSKEAILCFEKANQ